MLRKFTPFVIVSLLLSLSLSATASPTSPAALNSVTSASAPLPLTCSGPTAPAPCVYGYVYYGDTPVSGANVTIDSQFGTLPIQSSSGGFSSDPYFQASLGGPPLLVSVGDVITLTTSYSGSTASSVFTVLPGGQQIDLVVQFSPLFGNGQDGDKNVVGDVDLNTVRASASGSASSNVLSISNLTGGGFLDNQLVLIHQTRGTNVGVWEFRTISAASSTHLTLTVALSNTYTTDGGVSRAQVMWVPQYRNFTLGSGQSVTPQAWNGNIGGVVGFLATGTVLINGTINVVGGSAADQQLTSEGQTAPGATGVGFGGGAFYGHSGATGGFAGEGTVGVGGMQTAAYGNAGGGGTKDGDPYAGAGGGGGNGGPGTSGFGSDGVDGAGGSTAGSQDLTTMVFGGGGGGGTKVTNVTAGGGGAGGGIILLAGRKILLSGSANLIANGGNGGSGSGAGAGGSILLRGQEATLGTTLVTAAGGAGGDLGGGLIGGNGGVGRIHLDYFTAYSGTTSPALNVQSVQCGSSPIPTINSISPASVIQSQAAIQFVGQGASPELCGTAITAYVWRYDSVPGTLSTQSNFTRTAASFSVGSHIIYFKVRDSHNVWSQEISRTITIQSSSAPTPTHTPTSTATRTATPTQATPGAPANLHLPMIVRLFGSFEIEPNNSLALGNGPLISGLDYHGYQNDDRDYFKFLSAAGHVTVELTNTSAPSTQLEVYYLSAANSKGQKGAAPYSIEFDGAAGWYYVRIIAGPPFNSVTPYTLRVTYP